MFLLTIPAKSVSCHLFKNNISRAIGFFKLLLFKHFKRVEFSVEVCLYLDAPRSK